MRVNIDYVINGLAAAHKQANQEPETYLRRAVSLGVRIAATEVAASVGVEGGMRILEWLKSIPAEDRV